MQNTNKKGENIKDPKRLPLLRSGKTRIKSAYNQKLTCSKSKRCRGQEGIEKSSVYE